MADYHSVIARAVAGLEKNTSDARRALYDRARAALIAQLRGVKPALTESQIDHERLALDSAIREVEAEAVPRSRETTRANTASMARAAAKPPNSRSPAELALMLHSAIGTGDSATAIYLIGIPGDHYLQADKDGWTPLHVAAFKGDLEVLELLLSKGAPPDTRDKTNKWTPLHYVAAHDHSRLVAPLIKAGADPNAISGPDANTPLHIAVAMGYPKGGISSIQSKADLRKTIQSHPDVASELLKHGADPNKLCRQGRTPLHLVAERGDIVCAEILVAGGAHLDARGAQEATALHWAAATKKGRFGSWLVQNGALPDLADALGWTPLFLADANGTEDLVPVLLAAGARTQATINGKSVSFRDTRGKGASPPTGSNPDEELIEASKAGNVAAAKSAIDAGADVNCKGRDGRTPLVNASLSGHIEVVRALIAAKADVNARIADNITALYAASQNCHLDVVKALLAAGADVNAKQNSGATALYMASQDGHVEVVQTLIAAKADVNPKIADGSTALIIAVKNGYVGVVRALLNAKADVNIRLPDGAIALTIAVVMNHQEIADLLRRHGSNRDDDLIEASEAGNFAVAKSAIDAGANVNCRFRDGWTPLLSASKDYPKIVELLLASGADPNLASNRGYTPLMRAAGHGADENVRALIAAGANLEAKDNENQSALDMAYSMRFPMTAKILEDALRPAGKTRSPAATRTEPARDVSPAGPPGSLPPIASRTIPLFVSSTFLDMHAERDLLRTQIIPLLEEKLKERNVQLELVDLRWGVDASAEREQRARMLRILRVCFAEVERCRPYFITLLGERHGTVPPAHLVRGAAMEAGLATPADGRSVTELEILYYLEKVGHVARFFAYMRDRLPFEQLVRDGLARPQVAANYAGDPADRVEGQRIEGLRTLLRTRCPDRTKTYAAQWNAKAQAVDGLAAWRDQIVQDLWVALDEDSKAWVQQAPKSLEEAEGRAIEQFLSRPPSSSEARPGELDRVVAVAKAKDNETATWGWAIGGEVGSGKTALLAGLCRRLRADGVFYLAHFVGLTPTSTSIVAMFRRWIAELRASEGNGRAEPEDIAEDGIAAVFWRLLRRVSVDRRIVLVIDNLDAFGSEDRLNWHGCMSFVRPSNVRTILSLCNFDQSQFRRRSSLESMKLEALTKPMADSLIAAINAKYHRQAPASVVRKLLDKRRPDGQSAAGNTRWLSVAVEELNLIGREEFEEARQDVSVPGEQQIQRLLEKAVDDMQPTIDGLYASVLARAYRLDPQLTPAFAKLVALAKEGLGNNDLAALLREAAGSCDDAQLASLRRNFRGHLRQTSDLGLWQFSDPLFRDAVLGHYKVPLTEQVAIHRAVVRYLMTLPPSSELRSRELMHHLIGADDRVGLARYWVEVTDEAAVVKDPERARRATLTITAEVARRGPAGVSWATSLLRLDGLTADEKVKLYTALFDLIPLMLGDRLPMSERQGLFTALAKAIDTIRASGPASFDADKARLGCDIEIGKAALEAGNLRDAERTFRQALTNADQIISSHGAAVQATIREGQAMAHEGLGKTMTALGRLDEAIASHQSAITSLQNVKAAKNAGELSQRMAHSLIYIGELKVDLRQYDQAQKCFQEAYQAAQLAGEDLPRDARELTMSLAREREGDLRLKLDDLDGALQAFTEVRRYRATLLDLRAGTLEVFNEGVSAEKMGNVLERQGKFAEAIRSYEHAQSAYKLVASAEPTNVLFARALAAISGSIGDARWGQKDATAARAAYGHQIEILETLRHAGPENADILRRYMTALISIGELEKDTERLDLAQTYFEAATRIADNLLKINRDNATAARDLAVIHTKRALLFMRQGKNADAAAGFEKSAALLDTALRLAPTDRRLRFDKAGVLWNLGSLLTGGGQNQRMMAVYRECHSEYAQLASGGRLPPPHDEIFAELRQMFS